MIKSPFFTIIVVALNAENLITETINSVLNQTCNDYEIVVKDGLSKDNTISKIPFNGKINIISEEDFGIYDAMNQGIKHSRGQYIIFMNCGDTFASQDVLDKMKKNIGNNIFGMAYGNYIRDGIVHQQPSILSRFYMYRTPLCHQTVFFNGDYLRNEGLYNTQYKILADYDLELRLMNTMNVTHIDILVCSYLGGGVSESKKGIDIMQKERNIILKDHFSKSERFRFKLMIQMTFPKLRSWIVYGNSPRICKKVYQLLVNFVNK